MKKTLLISTLILISMIVTSCNGNKNQAPEKTKDTVVAKKENVDAPLTAAAEGKVQHITSDQFVKYVNDFRTSPKYSLKSELPCVVDMYTDWCKPCKMIAPLLDQLAKEYQGKVNFLKINIDEQPEIANFYQVQAIPTMMFCPKNGEMKVEVGGADKATIKERVQKYLFK